MHPEKRTLLQVSIADAEATVDTIDRLMGNKPEARFQFIQERADFVEELDL